VIRTTSWIICAVLVFVASRFANAVQGDEKTPIKLALHPAAEPSPALKYRLLPPASEQISGNAAVSYGKVTAEQWAFFTKYANTDVIDTWREMPLEKLRHERIRLPTSSILFLEQGAKCKYCDWQLPLGEMPFYTIMLPDAQQCRSYSRILAVKARIEIANGKFDDAIQTFQTNYALAGNVARGETLVNGLIGIAINGIMVPQITEYVQKPDAPNLYWAFTILPDPLIDMRRALDMEANAVELSFPEFRDLSITERTADGWRELFHRFATQIFQLIATGDPKPNVPSPEELDKACQRALPIAKLALVKNGLSPEKVEAMPVHQVALLYTMQLQHELVDASIKSYSQPFPKAVQGIEAAKSLADRAKAEGGEIVPIASFIHPAILATRTAVARGDRQIAVLRVIEALRIYASNHGGKLPDQLSDIREVPIPVDPVTTKAFEYRLDGDKAILQGPTLADVPLNYEITMTPAK
jgi:hypothetical protein